MLQEPPRTVMARSTQITIKAPFCSQLRKPESGEAFLKKSKIEADSLAE